MAMSYRAQLAPGLSTQPRGLMPALQGSMKNWHIDPRTGSAREEYYLLERQGQLGHLLAMRRDRIVVDPRIMMGKPVVAGTRLTVELILEKLAAGESVDQILAAHPRLTREGVRAALDFAGKSLRADTVYPIPASGA